MSVFVCLLASWKLQLQPKANVLWCMHVKPLCCWTFVQMYFCKVISRLWLCLLCLCSAAVASIFELLLQKSVWKKCNTVETDFLYWRISKLVLLWSNLISIFLMFWRDFHSFLSCRDKLCSVTASGAPCRKKGTIRKCTSISYFIDWILLGCFSHL